MTSWPPILACVVVLALIWLWASRIFAMDWKVSRTFLEQKRSSPALTGQVPAYHVTQAGPLPKQWHVVERHQRRSVS